MAAHEATGRHETQQGGVAPAPQAVAGTPPTREQVREQVRSQVRAALKGAQGTAPLPPGQLTTSTGDNPFDPLVMARMQETAEHVSYMFFVTIAVIIVGLPLARAIGRRIAAPTPPKPLPSEDLGPKLRQLQESVDALAIELERVSENQRFTTRLLSERPDAPGALPQALSALPPEG